MMNDPKIDQDVENQANMLDLVELFAGLWKRRNVVFLFTAAAALLAVVYLHLATYVYTAELKVVPIAGSSTNLTSKLGGLGNLAALTGVQLPQDSSGMQFRLYVEGLRSRFAADALAKNDDVMKVLYKTEWDEETKSWHESKSPIRYVAKAAKAILGVPDVPWQPPNGARIEKFLANKLDISEDPKKMVVTIQFEHSDPQFAVTLLAALNRAVDGELRRKAILRSSQNIDYLTRQLKTVTLAEQREAIIRSLGDQEKVAMMANSTASFAAETFGQPYVSYRPTSPKPGSVLMSAILVGIILGSLLASFAPEHLLVGVDAIARRLSLRRLFGSDRKKSSTA